MMRIGDVAERCQYCDKTSGVLTIEMWRPEVRRKGHLGTQLFLCEECRKELARVLDQARLLTVDEAMSLKPHKRVFLERKTALVGKGELIPITEARYDVVDFVTDDWLSLVKTCGYPREYYGINWRLWTKRPTEGQSRGAKWRERE